MTRRTLTALLSALLCLALAAGPAAAQDPTGDLPTDDPDTAAAFAGAYIASQLTAEGYVPYEASDWTPPELVGEPDFSSTTDALLGLAASGASGDRLDAGVAFVADRVTDYVRDAEDGPRPGPAGKVALLVDATGGDPRDVAGTDLVDVITEGVFDDGPNEGLLAEGDVPNPFAATINHAYALLGLAVAGEPVEARSVDWLVNQQCEDGSWVGYAAPDAETDAPREAFDPCLGQPDEDGEQSPLAGNTNATAFALQALAALDGLSVASGTAALDFLAESQTDDGGFVSSAPFTDADVNSTALVIQSIVALDGDPTDARWTAEAGTPVDFLLASQLGCEARRADRGALTFGGEASLYATNQGVWGLAQQPFPFTDIDRDADVPVVSCPLTSARFAGAERVATAIDIALRSFPAGSDDVVLATAEDYADALAGGPLAAALDAPILLTPSAVLPGTVRDAIADLGATTVTILGGTAAVSAEVATAVEAIDAVDTVERISGPTRFDTAADIAARLDTSTVYIAQGADPAGDPGRGWPDALTVAPLAAFGGNPVLLVVPDALPTPTADAIAQADSVVIVGGTVAISTEVREAIAAAAPGAVITEVAGANRYATAAGIAEIALEAGMLAETTWLATGRAFPDALTAGAVVGARGDLLALVDGENPSFSPESTALLEDLAPGIDRVHILGGTRAVSEAAQTQVMDLVDAAR